MLIGCLYLPNGNPAPGPKFDYKLRWFARLVKVEADREVRGWEKASDHAPTWTHVWAVRQGRRIPAASRLMACFLDFYAPVDKERATILAGDVCAVFVRSSNSTMQGIDLDSALEGFEPSVPRR